MDTMTNPTTHPTTTGWTLLSSYGAAPTLADVELPPHGTSAPTLGCCVDAVVVMGQPDTGVFRDTDAFAFAPRIKDIRPVPRAWSPPV